TKVFEFATLSRPCQAVIQAMPDPTPEEEGGSNPEGPPFESKRPRWTDPVVKIFSDSEEEELPSTKDDQIKGFHEESAQDAEGEEDDDAEDGEEEDFFVQPKGVVALLKDYDGEGQEIQPQHTVVVFAPEVKVGTMETGATSDSDSEEGEEEEEDESDEEDFIEVF
ncbi:hypothetical protein BGX29_012057, partial [Mortierella sp. GBA35]